MAKAKAPPRAQPPSSRPPPALQQVQQPQRVPPPPSSLPPADLAAPGVQSAKKKKKKKGTKKTADDGLTLDSAPSPPKPASPLSSPAPGPMPTANSGATGYSATAQAQADLLATASDLYRRIEADPQGIPDDDAYWTSLPAHLRTFIRNALPLGQFPPTQDSVNPNDPNARHASTQAMIAVAQQLAQAAHASQRHLQQYPPGTHPYPPLPFDPSIFADLALHPDQPLPLHPHPNSTPNGPTVQAQANVHAQYGHVQYSTNPNPPPTQPPGEPLPAPVVLVNEYGEETGEYEDDYYSDDELDDQDGAADYSGAGVRKDAYGMPPRSQMVNGLVSAALAVDQEHPAAKKSKKKKKKKGGGGDLMVQPQQAPMPAARPPVAAPPVQQYAPPSPAPTPAPVSVQAPRTGQPPPSSRAAGKQPMTFNSTAKPAARSAAPPAGAGTNGLPHAQAPSSTAAGKRPAAAPSNPNSHGPASSTGPPTRIWSTSSVEERERIKDFWLGLSEKERRDLVKVEKEAVLRKMKDQQKHNCSCAVCGRKRTAIEEELEVLYDAYYDELEQYANHQQQYASSGGAIPPPPGPGPFPGSVALDNQGAVIGGEALGKAPAAKGARHPSAHPPGRNGAKKTPLPPEQDEGYDEDELDDEEYEDEYDEEEEEEDEEEDELEVDGAGARTNARGRVPAAPAPAAAQSGNDFFSFGSSLTVKGVQRLRALFENAPCPSWPQP